MPHSGILRTLAYPFLSDVLRDAFGVDIWLPVPMFGLMVGVALFVSIKLTDQATARDVHRR